MTIKVTSVGTSLIGAKDAIALLKADHATVSELFSDDDKVCSEAKKQTLVSEMCIELSVHAQIKKEILYPAAKAAVKGRLLVSETTAEQAGVKELIVQLEGLKPDSDIDDAKVRVLFEYVKHHVKEERNEVSSNLGSTSLNLVELGARMATRKADLLTVRG